MPKRVLNGVVVSDKNDKTVVVEVERRYTHPLFKKTVRRTKKYQAHDEGNAFKNGDRVVTQGGIHGTVVGVSENTVQVRVADNVKLDFARNAVAGLQAKPGE